MLGPLCNQTVNLETDAKILYYSLLKKEITLTGYSTKKSSNKLIVLCILWDACHELVCVFGDFYASGMQDTEVTKSLTLSLVGRKVKLLVYQ